ncbi:hypothetical protein PG5_65460 [Pseudomonas sp. G5(2012)]|nr:hypothetical protein PG5_65460 [Pseudomonas sp. G5(2012)]
MDMAEMLPRQHPTTKYKGRIWIECKTALPILPEAQAIHGQTFRTLKGLATRQTRGV